MTLPDLPKLPDASLWVLPGDDGGRASGFVDAMAWQEGEFTKPMFTADQMREYALKAYRQALDEAAHVAEAVPTPPGAFGFRPALVSAIRALKE